MAKPLHLPALHPGSFRRLAARRSDQHFMRRIFLLPFRTPVREQAPIGDDFVAISSSGLKGDKLILMLINGGGCQQHTFQLNWDGTFPAQAVLELSHNANGDTCKAIIRERLQFDLSVIIENPGQYVLRVNSGVTELIAHSPDPFFAKQE